MGYGYPFDSAVYFINHKWFPGCNDYPLGDEFNYEENKVTIKGEWITGSFDLKEVTHY